MTTSTTGEEIASMQARHAGQRARVIATATSPMLGNLVDDEAAEVISAALMELAAVWREEADWNDNSGRRGGKGTAKVLRECASRVAGFAVSLQRHATERPVEISAEAQAVVDALTAPRLDDQTTLALSGDAALDYLTGATDTYNAGVIAVQPVSPSPFSHPTNPLAPAPMSAIVDNPFTHPTAPGQLRNRNPVAVIPFSALEGIATATLASRQRTNVSHSFVETYASCGLKAMLNDASRAGHVGAQRPGWALVGGRAFHACVEQVERGVLDGSVAPPRTPDDIEALWLVNLDVAVKNQIAEIDGSPYADPSTWHVAASGKEGFDWWRVEGVGMLANYVKVHNEAWRAQRRILTLDGRPVLEYAYEMTVRTLDGAASMTAKGYIDAVWIDIATGNLIVTDHKTGASTPRDTFQLGEYAHALTLDLATAQTADPIWAGLSTHEPTVSGQYFLARKGIYTDPVDVLAAHPLDELRYRYAAAMRGYQAGAFAPNVTNFCTSCGARDYCPAVSS